MATDGGSVPAPPAPAVGSDSRPAAEGRPFRLFRTVLGVCLTGYTFFRNGFAHLQIPGVPIYPGEIALAAGLPMAASAEGRRRIRAILATWPGALLLAWIAFGWIRALPDVPKFGFLALRDVSLCTYALFAFLAAAACPEGLRWGDILRRVRYGYPFFLLVLPIASAVYLGQWKNGLPPEGWQSNPLAIRADFASLLVCSLAILYVLSCIRGGGLRIRAGLFLLLAGGEAMFLSLMARTAFLNFVFGAALMVFFFGRRPAAWFAAGWIAAFGIFWAGDIQVDFRTTRDISARKWAMGLRESLSPIIGPPTRSVLVRPPRRVNKVPKKSPSSKTPVPKETIPTKAKPVTAVPPKSPIPTVVVVKTGDWEGTMKWRIEVWRRGLSEAWADPISRFIGLGFGRDIFFENDWGAKFSSYSRGLRAPHNAHVTVAVRMGGVGLALWLAFHAALVAALWRALRNSRGAWAARNPADGQWLDAGMLRWAICYVTLSIFTATFNVILEGPMGAVWHWTAVGVALAMAARFLSAAPTISPSGPVDVQDGPRT